MTVTKVEPHESIPGAWYIEETITQEQLDKMREQFEAQQKAKGIKPIIIASTPCGPNWYYEATKNAAEEKV